MISGYSRHRVFLLSALFFPRNHFGYWRAGKF